MKMKAMVLTHFGGAENLHLQEVPAPTLQADEVLLEVRAISINPVDVKTRAGKGLAGKLKGQQPLILGWDVSGVVTETGASVTGFQPGDEVFGMVRFPGHGQAYAAYVAAPASHLALKPPHLSHEEAAAATLAALTAWEALTDYLQVQSGDKVLVHAAAGGVGHYAVQLAKHLGAYVIGTASAANRDFVLDLGADEHIDYRDQSLEEKVSGVDKVLDTIGGQNIDRSLKRMKQGGTLLSIVSGQNDQVAEKAAAAGMTGKAMLVQSNGRNMQQLAALLQSGVIRSHVSRLFAFEDIAAAHRQIETGRTVGKIAVNL